MNFKNLLAFCLTTSQPAVRPSSASATALESLQNKVIAKGVNKLVGKVSINLLCHTKLAICLISIIINAPAIA